MTYRVTYHRKQTDPTDRIRGSVSSFTVQANNIADAWDKMKADMAELCGENWQAEYTIRNVSQVDEVPASR